MTTHFTRCKYSFGIQRVLDCLIQFVQRAAIERVGISDLVHERQMRSVLAPALTGTVINEHLDQRMHARSLLVALFVKHEAHNVMHLAHSHGEGAYKVKPGLNHTPLRDGVLLCGSLARHLGDWAEEEMSAARDPVYPSQLVKGGNTLERFGADVEDTRGRVAVGSGPMVL